MTASQWQAYVDDAREALALYESIATNELIELQAAHTLDQARATRPESIVFGAGRLALIARVLQSRAPRETPDTVGPVGVSDPVAP